MPPGEPNDVNVSSRLNTHHCGTSPGVLDRRFALKAGFAPKMVSTPGYPMETREILLKADRIVVALERLEDGKTRATSGKEVIARYTHRLSARANEPFVALRCGSLAGQDGERLLFGEVL
jgi:transcriptional regulator of acetoin/glycerol metabolism